MSPWLHPGFLVTAAGALIGLAAWFIRLESKTNSNSTEVERIKQTLSTDLSDAKKHREMIEETLYKHLMDGKVHYNEQFFTEFRQTLDKQFRQFESRFEKFDNKIETVNSQLSSIGAKIDHLGK